MTAPPRLFLGGAANPFAEPLDWQPWRVAQKVATGAQFIQTQYCYDVPRLKAFLARLSDMGLSDWVFILVGVGPLASAKSAEWIRKSVPGVHIPDAVIRRLAGAEKPKAEGRKLCVEIMQEVATLKGVHGVHLMAYKQEDAVADMVASSGVLNGRTPWSPARSQTLIEGPSS